MKALSKRLLFWTPRILCLLFAGFISLFALDVFGEARGFWPTLVALAIHLIPTWMVLAILAVAWRWEWVGGVLFNSLGAFYVLTTWGRVHWSAYVAIGGPLFLMGALFLANWFLRTELRHEPQIAGG